VKPGEGDLGYGFSQSGRRNLVNDVGELSEKQARSENPRGENLDRAEEEKDRRCVPKRRLKGRDAKGSIKK